MPFVLITDRWEWVRNAETWKNISTKSEYKKQTDYKYMKYCPNTIAIKRVKIKQQLGVILTISLANVLMCNNI